MSYLQLDYWSILLAFPKIGSGSRKSKTSAVCLHCSDCIANAREDKHITTGWLFVAKIRSRLRNALAREHENS